MRQCDTTVPPRHAIGQNAIQEGLGIGYVPPEQAEPGSVIDIGLLDARCRATVLAEPIYDPANERLAS